MRIRHSLIALQRGHITFTQYIYGFDCFSRSMLEHASAAAIARGSESKFVADESDSEDSAKFYIKYSRIY